MIARCAEAVGVENTFTARCTMVEWGKSRSDASAHDVATPSTRTMGREGM